MDLVTTISDRTGWAISVKLTSPTDDLVRFWRSKVPRHQRKKSSNRTKLTDRKNYANVAGFYLLIAWRRIQTCCWNGAPTHISDHSCEYDGRDVCCSCQSRWILWLWHYIRVSYDKVKDGHRTNILSMHHYGTFSGLYTCTHAHANDHFWGVCVFLLGVRPRVGPGNIPFSLYPFTSPLPRLLLYLLVSFSCLLFLVLTCLIYFLAFSSLPILLEYSHSFSRPDVVGGD